MEGNGGTTTCLPGSFLCHHWNSENAFVGLQISSLQSSDHMTSAPTLKSCASFSLWMGNPVFSGIESANLHNVSFFLKSLNTAGFNGHVEKSKNTKKTRSANENEAFDLGLHWWLHPMPLTKHPIYDFASYTPGECLMSRNDLSWLTLMLVLTPCPPEQFLNILGEET